MGIRCQKSFDLVVVGVLPGIGSRHAEHTFYAYHLLPAREHLSADGAGSGKEQVDDVF